MPKRTKTLTPKHPRYKIIRRLGSGGGGTVFLARDHLDEDREVAFKIAHHEVSPDEVRREFRLLRELRHPAIARAFDFGRLPGTAQAYFTMEYVPGANFESRGATLRRQIEAGQAGEVIDIFLQVAGALNYIHQRGLLHLDLKPSNVVFSDNQVKLIDFGLFQNADASTRPAKGTVYYAAPEVLIGRPADARADLYSLGVTFYRCLTGKYPISGRSIAEIVENHRSRVPNAPERIPKELSRVIMKLLAKSARHRFQSAREVEDALIRLADDPSRHRRFGREVYPVPDFVGRKSELKRFFFWMDGRNQGVGPKTFIVEGAAGLGKTRFVDACVTEMLGYGIEVICLPDYASTQADGMRHLIERLLLARGLSGRQRLQYRFLLASVGLSSNRKMQWELQQLSVGQIRVRVFKEVLRLLGEWGEQPLVLVIDDFHTADAPLMDFVHRLSAEDSNEKKPEHLGLLLSRQVDEATRAVKPPKGTVGIRLRGLKQQEITKSLERLKPIVGAKKLALAAKTSRGHPGLFAHLAHQVLVGEKPDDESAVPDLGAMMTRRLEALDHNALTLILYLKLLDQSTGETALRELTGLSKAIFGRVRRELNKAGLLRVSRRGYSLAQRIPDDSVFPRVDPDDLLVARRNVGHKLRRSARHLPQAALLLLDGGEVEVGLSTVRDAGKQLFYAGRVETALDLYTAALSYAHSARDRVEFLELQGDLLNKSGEFEEAMRSYSQLFSEQSLSPQERVRVMRKLGGVHQRAGDNDSARKVFEEALQLLDQRVDDLDEHLHLLNELAALHLFRGDFAQSTTLANRGLELLRSGDTASLDPRTRGLHDLNLRSVAGHILLRQFEHEAAAAEFSKSLKISESIGTLSNTSLILNNLGVAYFSGNHLRNALRVYNRAVRLAREMGDDTAVFSILCNVAGIRARLGELRAAEELLESIEEMPHPQRSRRARLFFLHTKGLIGRVTLNDCATVWQESIELADEIPDPVIARYARVYSLENELFQGRWVRARKLLKELERLEDDDARLRRAIDSRKAYLDSLCGKAGMPTPWLTRSYVFDQTSSKSSQNVDNGTLWDWIFGAYALLEQGKHADAERCVERAWAEFVRLRQPPGALECCLVLADIALRRRNATQASRWLKEARKVLSSHDTSAGSRAALVRIPFLESRLGMLGERRSRTYVSDRLVDAGGHLPVRSNVEIGWLLDLIAVEQGSPRATRNLRVSRSRFVESLQPDDRTGYLARDHRLRLGLLSTQTEISKPSLPNAAEKHLNALITITQERNFRKILNVILDACESSAGTIFLDDDTTVPDSHAIEGVGNKFPKSVRTAVLRQGSGSVDDGVCVEIAPRQGRRLGVLYVHAPPNEGDGLSGFLQLAAGGLAELLQTVTSSSRPGRESNPRLIEDTRETESLASMAMIESRSSRMRELIALVHRTKDSRLPVLLTGESGVGKDLLARWIHSISVCHREPFVSLDCSAIPEALFEAELFGYEAGAFTGAEHARQGRLIAAEGGTVYLDNVDSIAMDAQTKILRILEEEEVRALGSAESTKINVRIIASTQRELRELCEHGHFRSDLYFRLAGICLDVPPLRERVEDISELIRQIGRQLPGSVPEFTTDGLDSLKTYAWPGNVRELESLIRRLSLTADGPIGRIEVAQALGVEGNASTVPRWFFEGRTYDQVLDDVKREYLLYLYERCEGDTNRLARELNTTRRNVYQRFVQAGLRTAELRLREPRKIEEP